MLKLIYSETLIRINVKQSHIYNMFITDYENMILVFSNLWIIY